MPIVTPMSFPLHNSSRNKKKTHSKNPMTNEVPFLHSSSKHPNHCPVAIPPGTISTVWEKLSIQIGSQICCMLQQHIVSAIETNASLGWSELSVAGGGRCPELSWIFPSVIDYFGRVELSDDIRYCIAAWLYLG